MTHSTPEDPTRNVADDVQRRRLLVASLRASGVVAGALTGTGVFAVPVPPPGIPGSTPDPSVRYKTADTNGKLCTVSGAQSGVLSGTASGGVCSGYTPSQFATPGSQAANDAAAAGFDLSHNRVGQLFSAASDADKMKTLQVALAESTNLSYWVAAYLNGQISNKPGSSIKFPYGSNTVSAKYGNGDFVTFIKNYFN